MNLRPSAGTKATKSFMVNMTGSKSNGVSPYKRNME